MFGPIMPAPPMAGPGMDVPPGLGLAMDAPPGLELPIDPEAKKQSLLAEKLKELQDFGKNDSLGYTPDMSYDQVEENNKILLLLQEALQKENKQLKEQLRNLDLAYPGHAFQWPASYPMYGAWSPQASFGSVPSFSMPPPMESPRDIENFEIANEVAKTALTEVTEPEESSPTLKDVESGLSQASTAVPSMGASLSLTGATSLSLASSVDPSLPTPAPSTYSAPIGEEIPIERCEDGRRIARWNADAKKLQSRDRQMVSPPFALFPNTTFKVMISPKLVGDKKGQASFQKAKGIGSVTLKCSATGDGDASFGPELEFYVSVGKGEQFQGQKGPVKHDFGSSSVCRNPIISEDWNFMEARDPETGTFQIAIEVLAQKPIAAPEQKETEP